MCVKDVPHGADRVNILAGPLRGRPEMLVGTECRKCDWFGPRGTMLGRCVRLGTQLCTLLPGMHVSMSLFRNRYTPVYGSAPCQFRGRPFHMECMHACMSLKETFVTGLLSLTGLRWLRLQIRCRASCMMHELAHACVCGVQSLWWCVA